MYKFEIRVGRLAEATLGSPLTAPDLEGFITATRLGLLALPGKAVVACDMSRLAVLPDDLADRAIELIRRDSPKIERGGYLVSQRRSSTSMQITRLFREAKSETRRVFDDKTALRSWLAELLTPAELQRLGDFLAEIPTTVG
jgi:hypothetical protein